MPFAMILSYVFIYLAGTPIPSPKIALIPTLVLAVLFFIGAVGEELGWSGYAIDPLLHQFGALKASLVLGAVWAVFHYIVLLQVHRSVEWIAWWTLGTLALRVIMVWLYNNTGEAFLQWQFFI